MPPLKLIADVVHELAAAQLSQFTEKEIGSSTGSGDQCLAQHLVSVDEQFIVIGDFGVRGVEGAIKVDFRRAPISIILRQVLVRVVRDKKVLSQELALDETERRVVPDDLYPAVPFRDENKKNAGSG